MTNPELRQRIGNREIKFRGWDEADGFHRDKGEMTYDIRLGERRGDYSVLMQYTGLKDKNDKEIYEGDILKDEKGNLGIIVWDQGDCCFNLIDKTDFLIREFSPETHIIHYVWTTNEVIGNLFNNPELLNE